MAKASIIKTGNVVSLDGEILKKIAGMVVNDTIYLSHGVEIHMASFAEETHDADGNPLAIKRGQRVIYVLTDRHTDEDQYRSLVPYAASSSWNLIAAIAAAYIGLVTLGLGENIHFPDQDLNIHMTTNNGKNEYVCTEHVYGGNPEFCMATTQLEDILPHIFEAN